MDSLANQRVDELETRGTEDVAAEVHRAAALSLARVRACVRERVAAAPAAAGQKREVDSTAVKAVLSSRKSFSG